jgi:hypothetical protein
VLDVEDRFRQQDSDVRVVQAVEDSSPLPLADHETEVAEQAKLVGDSRLLHLDCVRELADRSRPLSQLGQDPHPARRRQRLHRGSDLDGGRTVDRSDRVPSGDSVPHIPRLHEQVFIR